MSLFVKVFTNFYTHRKTARLRALLGDDALWLPPRLWAYAAENQPDGDFSSYSDQELALLIGYSKDATSMLQALLQAGFMDPDRKLHDWTEHNGYHEVYAERAKQAAAARWQKERTKEKGRGEDKRGDKHCLEHASSIQLRLNKLYNRRETTTWSDKERKAFKALAITEPDLELIERYYRDENHRNGSDYRRRDLLTLLNNWTGELDRARKFKPAQQTCF